MIVLTHFDNPRGTRHFPGVAVRRAFQLTAITAEKSHSRGGILIIRPFLSAGLKFVFSIVVINAINEAEMALLHPVAAARNSIIRVTRFFRGVTNPSTGLFSETVRCRQSCPPDVFFD